MINQLTALDELIEAVEKGSDLGFRFWFEHDDAIPDFDTRMLCEAAHNGSLDAANALHDALLPGWDWCVTPTVVSVYSAMDNEPIDADMAPPARAWLLAILKAYRAQVECEA